MSANFGENITGVAGINRFGQTRISTELGAFTVSGGSAITMSVGAASSITSTGGNMSIVSTNNNAVIQGGGNSASAVSITATNAAGGINLLSGTGTGAIALTTGSGGIAGVTSAGNISLSANNATGSFTVNSASANQNLTLAVTGATDSQVLVQSSGTNATNTALVVRTTNTAGNIEISNNSGAGAGALNVLTGSGGLTATTNTDGNVTITAQGGSATFAAASNATGEHVLIHQSGVTDSSVILRSAGTNTTQAILIETSNTAGSIYIRNTTGSTGRVNILTGTGGLIASTPNGGPVSVTAIGATTTIRNSTNGAGQDLTLAILGSTDSSVIISSTGTGTDAIRLEATGTTGGIFATANGSVQIESNDATNGVQLATATAGIPVKIGTATSTTTIFGDLLVSGTTTTVNTATLDVEDNIVRVNSGPSGTSDGGMSIKRYQHANGSGAGDVVAETATETGTAQAGATTTITLAASSNATTDYYAGWWIRLTGGTGSGQVRRIKSYNGTTKVATIYTTADQSGILNNPTPVEGLDFATAPDNTSTYSLFPSNYILTIWDESADEYVIAYAPLNPGIIADYFSYANLHINNLVANNITANTINGAGSDVTTTVTLTNNSTAYVTVTGFPLSYGIHVVIVRPDTLTTGAYAVFVLGRTDSASKVGQDSRLVSARGATNNEQLDMDWPANAKPRLRFNPAPGGGGTTIYKLKIMNV